MNAKNAKSLMMKTLALLPLAGLTMGNQSCQKQAAVPKRTYKKIVEMGSIQAQPIQLPNGGTFDFKFVANQQMYGVVADSAKFAMRSSPPIMGDPSQSNASTLSESRYFNLTKADMQMVQKSFDISKNDYRATFSRTAWCMVNLPQAKLSGSINAFELIGGGGISLGYNSSGALSATAGGSIDYKFENAQLDVSMHAKPPLGTTILGSTNVTSKQTKQSIDLKINYGLFSLGPSYYFSTPLATVTKKALTLGLDQLAAQMTKDVWYTRVFADMDQAVILVGGNDVGMQVGDQLDIYNEQYAWDGEPCNSTYRGGIGTGDSSYYARVEIVSVGDQLSEAKVIKISDSNQGYSSIGAKAKLYKLKEDLTPADPTIASQNAAKLSAN